MLSYVQRRAVKQDVYGVEYIRRVLVVVVGNVPQVVVLQGDEEGQQHLVRDLEVVVHVAVLEQNNEEAHSSGLWHIYFIYKRVCFFLPKLKTLLHLCPEVLLCFPSRQLGK